MIIGIGDGVNDPVECGGGLRCRLAVGVIGIAHPGCGIGCAICRDGVEEGVESIGSSWKCRI